MRVKEKSERASLKLNIKKKTKTKIMAFSPITSWQIEGEKVECCFPWGHKESDMTERLN